MRSTFGETGLLRRGLPRLLAALVLGIPIMLASISESRAQCFLPGGGNVTFCSSETRSETVVNTSTTTTTTSSQIVVPGGGPLPGLLTQLVNGLNGSVVLNAFKQVMGPSAVAQNSTTTSTVTSSTAPTGTAVSTYANLGPGGPIPVGSGPGTINCNGSPPPSTGVNGEWPPANCNFAGYQTFSIAGGTTNLNTNVHTFFLTTVLTQISIVNQPVVNLTVPGFNWLTGDLHATFQTTILDDDFRFIDLLLGRGALGSPVGAAGLAPLGFSAEASISGSAFDEAFAYAAKAPRMMPGTTPLGGGWSAWARGNLGYSRYDTTATNFGFSAKSRSAELGVEHAREAWLFGAAAGFGRADVNQFNTGDSGRIDSVRAGLYGAYRPGPWRFSAAVTGGFHAIDATRLSLLPGASRSSYGAQSFAAGVEAARRLTVLGGVIEPMAGLVYTTLHVDNFTETGNGFLDLAGRSTTIDALKGYLGARAFRSIAFGGATITPEAKARVLYDFLDDPRGYQARFTADPAATAFPVAGLQPGRTAALIGGGLTVQLKPSWRAYANYDAEIRQAAISHLGTAGIKIAW